MLPLSLLTAAQGHPVLVELKDGESVNGHLVNCDTWMNLILSNVIQTTAEGDKFYKFQQCYIRGSNIKYLRLPEEVVDHIKDNQQSQQASRGGHGHGTRGGHQHSGRGDRGDRGGRGGQRGGRGRGRGRGS